MQRNIYERRAYASYRAITAVDRARQVSSEGSLAEREQAFRWMRLWMAFAASRPVASSANAVAEVSWYKPKKCG